MPALFMRRANNHTTTIIGIAMAVPKIMSGRGFMVRDFLW
jgi:hypothetical protein